MQISYNQSIPFSATIEVEDQQQWNYNCKTKNTLRVHDFSSSVFKHLQSIDALSNIAMKIILRKFCECVNGYMLMLSGYVMFTICLRHYLRKWLKLFQDFLIYEI